MGSKALADGAGEKVYVASIRGTINPGSANYLESAIEAATRADAQALVVELDTPGGLVSSVREMAQAVDQSHVPVVVYVTPAGASATSAGALLSLASHVAAMAPGSNIGAAHPVDSSGADVPGAMGQKILNDTTAFARGLAELRGRNAELAEAVVAKSRSFTAQEALKEKLIELVVADRAELLARLDGRSVTLGKASAKKLRTAGAGIVEFEMSRGQKLLHLLANPNIATILMSIGMLLIYVEVSAPGISIAGGLGVICLLVAFMSFQTLPIRTGGLILLLLGVAFMIAELFVTTHGALGIAGTIAFVLGLLWVIDPNQSDLVISAWVWVPAALTLGGGALLGAWAASRAVRLSRAAREAMGGGGEGGLAGYVGVVETVASDGLGGKALVRGETWDIKSAEPLKVGDPVKVERVQGMLAFVRKSQGRES